MSTDSKVLALVMLIKIARHAKSLEMKRMLTPAERRRLLKIRTAAAVKRKDGE